MADGEVVKLDETSETETPRMTKGPEQIAEYLNAE